MNNEIKCLHCGEKEFISLIYVPDFPVCDKCISGWIGDIR